MNELEQRLRSVGPSWFPETPDVVGPALGRLPDRRPRARVRFAVALAVGAALVGAAVLASSPGARSAVLDLLDRVPGVQLERRDSLPEVGYRDAPYWGVEVERHEAVEHYRAPLRFPEGFDDPDWLYWLVDQPGDMITAVWGDERRATFVFSQWHTSDTDLFYKVLGFNSDAESVTVDGNPGVWLSGAEHGVWYLAPGETRPPPQANHFRAEGYLAGNVLVWHDGTTTYRIEANVPKERALEIARSLLPPGE